MTTVVAGAAGAISTVLVTPDIEFLPVFQSWMVSTFTGQIIVTPLLLAFYFSFRRSIANAGFYRRIEGISLVLAISAISALTFGNSGPLAFAFLYLPTPLLFWATFRFGTLGATVGSVIVVGIALWQTILGNGPFAALPSVDDVTALQIFVASLSISFLLLASAVSERDIALQKLRKVQSELLFTNTHLAEANREQAEFTYAISHDLKSPTNTVRMLIDELHDEELENLSEDGQEIVVDAQHTILRMGKLVDDVLDYARTVGEEMVSEPINVGALASELVHDLKGEISETKAKTVIQSLPTIRGNAMQLRMLLQNLISNAIKFRSPERPPVITISATPHPGREAVTLSVSDNGIGISPEYHEKIFGLFQRLHTHGVYAGSGLGLTMCRRIATNHGGKIDVSSELGVGTEFKITLLGGLT